MDELSGVREIGEARVVLLSAARAGGFETALAMLDQALAQLDKLAPPLDGSIWEAYSAVLAEKAPHGSSTAATVVPLRRDTAR